MENVQKWGFARVQKLLSERRISPFSVDQYGHTLLYLAASFYKLNVCELLFEMGLTGEERDYVGKLPGENHGLVVQSKRDLQNFKATYCLFTSRVDGLNPASFGAAPFSDWEDFNMNSPILIGMWKLWQSQPTDHDHESWKAATRYLISLVTDHHHYKAYWSDNGGLSLLGQILNIVDRPFESVSIGCTFLDILSELNFDVVEYLRVESELHFDPSKLLPMLPNGRFTEYRERYLVISESPPSVSWDSYIEPEGSAFDIVYEFKNFSPLTGYYLEKGKEDWPFNFSQSFIYPWGLMWWALDDGERLKLKRIYDTRLQRRQDKKALKLAKARGIRRQVRRMPGAWIE